MASSPRRMVLWAAVGGLVGARILAIVDDWSGFVSDPLHSIFSGSGFVFYGGLIGGFIAVSWTIRRHGLPWLQTVDCIAPGLVLAQGIGRIGCQLAGDGDWGSETTLPWGMAYPNAIVGWPYPPGVRVHPAPLYEFDRVHAGLRDAVVDSQAPVPRRHDLLAVSRSWHRLRAS